MPKKTTKNTPLSDKNNEGVYFTELKITDLKCFHSENTINLTTKNGDFAQWTVILGNNNTGKTTILKSLAGFEPMRKEKSVIEHSGFELKAFTLPSFFDTVEKKNSTFITIQIRKGERLYQNLTYGCFWGTKNLLEQMKGENRVYSPFDFIKEHYNVKVERLTWFDEYVFCDSHYYGERADFQIYAYSTSRQIQDSETETETGNTDNLLENKPLMNCEKWLKELYLSEKLGNENAGKALAKIKTLLTSGILPDVQDFTIKSIQKGNTGVDNFIEFTTDYGAVRFRELGYGYQSMTAWVLDLVRSMMERYPDVENPLAQPAVVLVDEIDLHLHPEWQRKIIGFLSKHFPKTQFIVTAHSPLIVQSAESVNVVLLTKEGDKTVITQPETQNFTGWSVEEIMNEIMGLGERVHSDQYIALTKAFEIALENEDGKAAKAAFDALDAILPHNGANVDRKLMKIQMAGLEI